MPALTFSKWSPGGNTTLLFPDAGQRPAETLPDLAGVRHALPAHQLRLSHALKRSASSAS